MNRMDMLMNIMHLHSMHILFKLCRPNTLSSHFVQITAELLCNSIWKRVSYRRYGQADRFSSDLKFQQTWLQTQHCLLNGDSVRMRSVNGYGQAVASVSIFRLGANENKEVAIIEFKKRGQKCYWQSINDYA